MQNQIHQIVSKQYNGANEQQINIIVQSFKNGCFQVMKYFQQLGTPHKIIKAIIKAIQTKEDVRKSLHGSFTILGLYVYISDYLGLTQKEQLQKCYHQLLQFYNTKQINKLMSVVNHISQIQSQYYSQLEKSIQNNIHFISLSRCWSPKLQHQTINQSILQQHKSITENNSMYIRYQQQKIKQMEKDLLMMPKDLPEAELLRAVLTNEQHIQRQKFIKKQLKYQIEFQTNILISLTKIQIINYLIIQYCNIIFTKRQSYK